MCYQWKSTTLFTFVSKFRSSILLTCLVNVFTYSIFKVNLPGVFLKIMVFVLIICPKKNESRNYLSSKIALRTYCKLTKVLSSSLPGTWKFTPLCYNIGVKVNEIHGCYIWGVTPKLAKELYGCCTRMLPTVLNVRTLDAIPQNKQEMKFQTGKMTKTSKV